MTPTTVPTEDTPEETENLINLATFLDESHGDVFTQEEIVREPALIIFNAAILHYPQLGDPCTSIALLLNADQYGPESADDGDIVLTRHVRSRTRTAGRRGRSGC